MEITKKRFPLLAIIISYIAPMGLFLPISILFLGYIDVCLIIGFGFVNTLFLFYKLKLNLIPSIVFGYLISSISLILTYLFWFLNIYTNTLTGLILFILFSVLFLFLISYKKWKLNSKTKSIILLILTVISVYIATQLQNYYPLENKDLQLITFKALDINQNPLINETITVRRERDPLFNLMQSLKIAEVITDNNGEFTIQISESSNYDFILKNNYKGVNLMSSELKKKAI